MTTALITGANRGLGLEFVRQFARDGVKVIATCRKPAAASELAAAAVEISGNIEIRELDAASRSAIEALARQLAGRPIDYLVANAAISPKKQAPIGEIGEAEWLDVFRTNTLGPAYLANAFAESVAASERRVIAFISTRMTVLKENTAGSYYMYRSSKGALNQVARNLALEYAQRGITVVALHPGFVRTDMGGPRGSIDAAESVAGLKNLLFAARGEESGRFFDYTRQELNW